MAKPKPDGFELSAGDTFTIAGVMHRVDQPSGFNRQGRAIKNHRYADTGKRTKAHVYDLTKFKAGESIHG